MTEAEWKILYEELGEQVYEYVLEATGGGPFDGGCLLFARAMQKALGGEVAVLVREDDVAEHAVLLLDGILIDFDGPADPAEFVPRFNDNERRQCVGWRLFRDGDLPEAPTNGDTEDDLADLLGAALSGRTAIAP